MSIAFAGMGRVGLLTAGFFLGLGSSALSGAPVARVSSPLHLTIGPEEFILHDGGWPFVFQAAEGTTVVLGTKYWPKKQPEPTVFTVRSFDGRKTWQPWTPAAGQGIGPVTEGAILQLEDGRILIFNVYAYHTGGRVFAGQRWISRDGWKTVTGPEPIRASVPNAKVDGVVDDRNEPVSRLYLHRSVVALAGGDLLATAYGRFEEDNVPVEYLPAMKQSRVYLIRSHDEGLTWTYAGTVATPPCGQEGFGEPVLIRLRHGPRAGRLICQMRTGRENPLYQAESDDEGRTWSKPHALNWVYSRFGRQRDIVGVDPELTEMTDGTLVMGYGHKADFMDNGNFLSFSLDQGVTWTQETRLSTAMTRAYVGVREVKPGTLFVVYTTTTETDPAQYGAAKFETVARTITVAKASPPAPEAR